MGHLSIMTTMKYYAHLIEEDEFEDINSFASLVD